MLVATSKQPLGEHNANITVVYFYQDANQIKGIIGSCVHAHDAMRCDDQCCLISATDTLPL